jgi:hypothetical protein
MLVIERRTAIDLFGAALITVLLFQIDVFFAVFTVPLHVTALKRKDNLVLYAAGLAAAAIGIQEMIRFSGIGITSAQRLIVAVAVYAPVALLSATALYHWLAKWQLRRLYRFLMSLSGAAVYGFIIVVLFESDSIAGQQAREGMREQFLLLMQVGQQSGMDGLFSAGQAEQIYQLTVETIKRTFLLGTALQFGFALFVANLIHNRRGNKRAFGIAGFHAPEQLLWPFLLSWSVVLASLLADIGLVGIIGWNSAVIISLVYFFQGLAIIQVLLERKNRRLSPGMVILVLIALVIVPGINALFMIGIPLLGVSEIWIQYRVVNKENTDENNS